MRKWFKYIENKIIFIGSTIAILGILMPFIIMKITHNREGPNKNSEISILKSTVYVFMRTY